MSQNCTSVSQLDIASSTSGAYNQRHSMQLDPNSSSLPQALFTCESTQDLELRAGLTCDATLGQVSHFFFTNPLPSK